MDEIDLIQGIKEFATGNTLVLLYISISIVRYVFAPLYKGRDVLSRFFQASTNALNEYGKGHVLIATELKLLREVLSIDRSEKGEK